MSALGLTTLCSGPDLTGSIAIAGVDEGERYGKIPDYLLERHGLIDSIASLSLWCNTVADLNVLLFAHPDYTGSYCQFVLGATDDVEGTFWHFGPARSGLVVASNWALGDDGPGGFNYPSSVRQWITPQWNTTLAPALGRYGGSFTDELVITWRMFPEGIDANRGPLSEKLAYVELRQPARIHGYDAEFSYFIRFTLSGGKAAAHVVNTSTWVDGGGLLHAHYHHSVLTMQNDHWDWLQRACDAECHRLNSPDTTWDRHYLLPGNQVHRPVGVSGFYAGAFDDVTYVYCKQT